MQMTEHLFSSLLKSEKLIMKKIMILIMLIFLSGCATGWKKASPEQYKNSIFKFNANLPSGWMYFNMDKSFIITKDGVVLDVIAIERIRFSDKLDSTKKKFKEDMLPDEVLQVGLDNYKSNTNIQKFEVLSNEAVKLSGQDAYKLEYRYQTIPGLIKRGIEFGFIYDHVVYRVYYEAAEQYYFEQNKKVFEQFLKDFHLF